MTHSDPKTDGVLGAYLSTDEHGQIDTQDIEELNHIATQQASPLFYTLILHLKHKGRIDALMYSDTNRQTLVTLHMCEQP